MKKTNIFKAIPKDLKEELFEQLLCTNDLKIQKIVSKGHTSPKSGWYNQNENEWVMVLKGEAVLSFKNNKKDITLKKGDFINIPAKVKHKVSWTKPNKKTVWLAIYYK